MDRQAEEEKARQRFLLINLMRIAGVAMILFGIAIIQRAVSLPDAAGYVLIVMGFGETFIVPQILARAWSSNGRDGRR